MTPHDVIHRLIPVRRAFKSAAKEKDQESRGRLFDQAFQLLDSLSDDIAIHLPDNIFEKYGADDL